MTLDARMARLILDLRREGITDTRLLGAIEKVPRDLFVPEAFRDQAYANMALPIGYGQTVSQPVVVALMTQALDVAARMKVLEIGTGSGYQAAVLAHLCRRLYTVERHADLLSEAQARFKALGLHTITTRRGDGTKGWPGQAPFQRIMITAAADEVPAVLVDQLAEDGRMVVPVGPQGSDQELVRITRRATWFDTQSLGPVRFVPLVACAPQPVAGRRAPPP